MKGRCAADIMTRPVVTIGPDALLVDAIELLLERGLSGLPVVDAGDRLVGIITEHDIMNFALSGDAADTRVEDAMTMQVTTVPPEADMAVAINHLVGRRLRRVPVVEGERVVGIISRREILREMLSMYREYH